VRNPNGLIAVTAASSLLVFLGGACGSSTGTVTGVLLEVGGPPPGHSTPVGGTIRLSGSSGTFSTQANGDGRFSVAVPPGTYTIQGRPDHWGTAPGFPCGNDDVTVPTTGRSVATTVQCPIP